MNHDLLPSELLDQLSKQTLNFEYSILEAETRRVVQQRTNEIKRLMRRSSQDIIDIGQKLIEVKQHLGHGSFRNWLKFEFHWSRSTATKFMQVAVIFKFVNFTHLNITASTLYLIAAPSTPKEARIEVLERASNGENIGYTKAKEIVCQHRKTASLKSDKPVNVIEPTRYETTSAISAQEDLTEKEAQIETHELSSLELLLTTTIKNIPDNTTQISTSRENLVAISHGTSDAAIASMAISIKNLTPEQLARVIIKAAYNGLSEYQLSAIITASQQALNTRQQFGDRYEEVTQLC